MRRGREFYSKHYDKVAELHNQGVPIKEIAGRLGISYSCAYHWVKGLRKPGTGNLNKFQEYLEKNGPMPAIEAKEKFAKHNEIYLTASSRGMKIRRFLLPKRFGEYGIWYFLVGQEKELEKRVKELQAKVREIREKLNKSLET